MHPPCPPFPCPPGPGPLRGDRLRLILAVCLLVGGLWAGSASLAQAQDGPGFGDWAEDPGSGGPALLAPGTGTPAAGDPRAALSWIPLLERLVQEGEDRAALAPLFANATLVADASIMGRKMRALYRSRFLPRPEPKAPSGRPLTIYDTWLTPEWVEKIKAFQARHAPVLEEAARLYGTPPALLTAIFLVETHLGEFLGQRPVFAALANLAASTDPEAMRPFLDEYRPTPEQLDWLAGRQAERARWAENQLRHLLAYCRQNGFHPLALPGSLYGALGLCQFTPLNALRLGVDGDGDGRVDLFGVADAAHSMGRFLKSRGWRENLSYQAKVKVIRQYNNDQLYAETVLAVAKRI